jgi:mRNA-degrading endonuclease toxin of MazEF toxin-antitoxin module
MIRRGDVVMVEFPYTDAAQSKVRPAVAVLNDRDNQRLRKTVVAMITGNVRRKGDPSHLVIDPHRRAVHGPPLSFPGFLQQPLDGGAD